MPALLEMLPPPDAHREQDLIVRPLTEEEARSLFSVFARNGAEFPDLRWATFIGAVAPDGTVSENFLVVQLMIHAEPLNLTPGNEGMFLRLAHAAEEMLATKVGTCDVYCFTPAGKVAKMAQAMGMTMEPWCVMSKRVEGKLPVQPPESEFSNLEKTPEGAGEEVVQ
jgi:hypothetical protein